MGSRSMGLRAPKNTDARVRRAPRLVPRRGGIFRSSKTTDELFTHVKSVVPSDTKFRAAFCHKTLQTGRQVRFILHELERQRRIGTAETLEEPTSDTQTLSLEHILPRNPEAAGWQHLSPEEKKSLRFRLGNMALINSKDNGAIGDKSFAEKRAAIQRSQRICLTLDIIERTKKSPATWGRQEIVERQAMMADLAVARWPLHGNARKK